MIECMLCGRKFEQITGSHLRTHGIDFLEYKRRFPNAPTVSDDLHLRRAESLTEAYKDPALRKRLSETNLGSKHPHSAEACQKLRGNKNALGHTGTWTLSKETMEARRQAYRDDPTIGQRISESAKKARRDDLTIVQRTSKTLRETYQSDPSLGVQRAEALREAYQRDPTLAERHSEAMKARWKDPEFAAEMSEAQCRKPNNTELQLLSILNKHFPSAFEYTGDGKVWIEGRNPDFTNINGRKLVIEMFGDFWHDPTWFPKRPSREELIAHYKKYGFDCLVFDEYEVWCNVLGIVEKVRDSV